MIQITKSTMNKKGQMVIIGSIFLFLALIVLFLVMQFLPVLLGIGIAGTDEPFVKLVIQLFPFAVFIILLIAFFKIVRSE